MTERTSNYDKFPTVSIPGYSGYTGWDAIAKELGSHIQAARKQPLIIALECYHGTLPGILVQQLQQRLPQIHFIAAEEAMLTAAELNEKLYPFVTDDPVFGYISPIDIKNFYHTGKLKQLTDSVVQSTHPVICVYGTGALLAAPAANLIIYADMPRWEIQLRFRRNEVGNLGAGNPEDSFAYQYKRAFFVDWRTCDRLKKEILHKADYILDTTHPEAPKMITGSTLQQALIQTAQRPFRVVPFFDPGPWGGQWLKEVCDLDRSAPNYAWAFDCVPEENSVIWQFDNLQFETPAINVVFFQPDALLGKPVHEYFGEEFPIRFDFLDTMEGGNLSLQVHPLKEYIRQHFGMQYTQDESYYFMDAAPEASVYLGLKENLEPEAMLTDLEAAQQYGHTFEADKYVEKWPIKKHDHVLIPAGTIHCSGANNVVLEISATPYIFTFKLWDWGRLGLDGKPRPISLEHGKKNIQWNRTTAWTKQHIFNRIQPVAKGEGWVEEKTGLHEHFFIETRRHWFTGKVLHHTHGVVNVLNLVEGREAIVESPEQLFEPFVVHYAETFIIPAAVSSYTIRPHGESAGRRCGTLKAFINTTNLHAAQGS